MDRWAMRLPRPRRRPIRRAFLALAVGPVGMVLAACGSSAAERFEPPSSPTTAAPASHACPITAPGGPAFTPAERTPDGPPPTSGLAWYGSPALWTLVDPTGGGWWGLHVGDGRFTDKTFWWSEAYSAQEPGTFTVTAEHLDGNAPTVAARAPGGQGHQPFMLQPTHASVTVVGVDLPEPGCWRLTAEYKGATLAYVVQAGG